MLTNIAFYAPMKSPNHPVPSGDRTIGRGILAALRDMNEGIQVDLASELKCRESKGDRQAQKDIEGQASLETDRLLKDANSKDWQAWVTYHNYYKAPDLIGPAVCKALGIPYVLIEATRARKRLTGPWAAFAKATEDACDAAATIFYMTDRDFVALERDKPESQALVRLKPFLNRISLPAKAERPVDGTSMLAVGMLRHGDKLESYCNLSLALGHVKSLDWSLKIIGGGPAAADVKDLFAKFGSRVSIMGELNADEMAIQMAQSRLLVWPGVNEAFGMVYLEAQSFGNWVVSEDRPGVRDVIGPAGRMAQENDAAGFAAEIDTVFSRFNSWDVDSAATRDYVKRNHLRQSATVALKSVLTRLIEERQ